MDIHLLGSLGLRCTKQSCVHASCVPRVLRQTLNRLSSVLDAPPKVVASLVWTSVYPLPKALPTGQAAASQGHANICSFLYTCWDYSTPLPVMGHTASCVYLYTHRKICKLCTNRMSINKCIYIFFESGSHFVVQDGLKLVAVLLPQPPKVLALQACATRLSCTLKTT